MNGDRGGAIGANKKTRDDEAELTEELKTKALGGRNRPGVGGVIFFIGFWELSGRTEVRLGVRKFRKKNRTILYF